MWMRYPTELESDLSLYHRRSIGEWHRGEMSSRTLLAFVQHLPDGSALKTSYRGGHYSDSEQMAAVTANELLLLRASYYATHGGEQYEPTLFQSAGELAAEESDDDDGLDEERAKVFVQLRGEGSSADPS